jgi:7-cyano-7-deazaguanine synthase in queuosine biosynthesis
MTTAIEVLPHDAQQHNPAATPLRWARTRADGPTPDVTGTLGWDLDLIGPDPVAAADLARIAASAYLADRTARRPPTTFTRTIELTAHTVNPEPWNGTCGQLIEELLHWLTGDVWWLHAVPATPTDRTLTALAPADDVMLLSGGLDSLCGAVDHLADETERIHLSHYDGSTAVRHAQTKASTWLQSHATHPLRHLSIKICQTGPSLEPSSRSRSLLFAALAAATAAGASSPQVTVPENGFTSINPPLTAARGGALSTRSTHPGTFSRLNALLTAADISVQIANPYLHCTKGELLARAHEQAGHALLAGAADTLSCGKLDGARYPGGDANLNCGLCVACLVRRGSFTAGPYDDPTVYLVDHLQGVAYQRLLSNRRRDVRDVQQAILNGIDDTDILAVGDLPPETDFDAVVDLCQRGLQELSRVPLP